MATEPKKRGLSGARRGGIDRTADWAGAQPEGGIVAGTRIATDKGWQPVEAVTVGAQVLTVDAGLQEVIGVRRALAYAGQDTSGEGPWAARVPVWALRNRDEMLLLPEQTVMMESDTAEEIFGYPFAMIAARALVGYRGIVPVVPSRQVDVITLTFEEDQIIYGNSAALLCCPRGRKPGARAFEGLLAAAKRADDAPLSGTQARHLVACMIAEELGGALRGAGRTLSYAALD